MTGGTAAPGTYLEELRAVASEQPAALALVDGSETTTYGELIADLDRRAAVLLAAGLRPGARVAVVAGNSARFLISAFAVWAAGGVLATIYPSTAVDDLRYTLDNADPVLVMSDESNHAAVGSAAPPGVPVVRLDEDTLVVPGLGQARIPAPSDLRDELFLICYSSGTTSRPKAIMLSQSALHNGARTYAEVWRLTPADRTVVCLPMAWLYGLDSTSMATLLAGGTVISLRRARPELIVGAIEIHRATFLPAVTTVFAKVAAHLESLAEAPDLSSLRLAVSGGEPRNEAVFDRFRGFAGVAVHDTFCASECFPLITYDPLTDPEPVAGSAGKLVPRSELRVVGPDGRPVGVGETGEALSRGRGLMLGYWRDPDQTAQALTEDGWYRTKDLVRVDADGYVYVVGRLSDMIIRGGSNVSPAEVERVLRARDEVLDAVVVGVPDAMYGEAVTAAVVLAEGATLDVDRLRDELAEHLASYKVPTSYVAVESLPVSATTGKVDRRGVATLVRSVTKELT